MIPSLSTSSGYAPVVDDRSVTASESGVNRSAPPIGLSVAKEGRGPAAAGEIQVRAPIVIAVERRRAAADEELVFAVVDVVEAGGQSLLDEVGRRQGCHRSGAAQHPGPDEHRERCRRRR